MYKIEVLLYIYDKFKTLSDKSAAANFITLWEIPLNYAAVIRKVPNLVSIFPYTILTLSTAR